MRWNGSITDCTLHVFAKPANLLAQKCTNLARRDDSRAKKIPLVEGKEYTGRGDRCCRKLAFAVNDAAFCQVVWREFDPHPVARHDADKVLAHPTGNVGHNDVSTFDLNAKSSIGQGLRYSPLDLECFFLLFCHTRLCPMNDMGQPALEKVTPDRSPLRLAESYNPSIGLAGRSSRIARHGADIPICQRLRQTGMSAPQSNYNGKTAWPGSRRCETTAVLCVRHLARYHAVSSFAVQLNIDESAREPGHSSISFHIYVILREPRRPKDRLCSTRDLNRSSVEYRSRITRE